MENNFEDWSFEKLVQYSQGNIVLAIPVGDFNKAVWMACDLAIRWRVAQEKKQKESGKK